MALSKLIIPNLSKEYADVEVWVYLKNCCER